MKKHALRHPDARSFNDQSYDLLGSILLETETRDMLEEIHKSPDKKISSTPRDKHNIQLIHNHFRKQRTNHFFSQTLPLIAKAVAIFIGAVILVGGIAFATSKNARQSVLRLLITSNPEHSSISSPDSPPIAQDVLDQWLGYSYPTYIPADFESYVLQCHPNTNSAYYYRKTTGAQDLSYTETSKDFSVVLDTENAILSPVSVRGYPATLIEKGDCFTLHWQDDHRLYYITYNHGNISELMQIAESLIALK